MTPKKIVYYTDEVHEDFAATNGKIGRDRVDGTYRYSRRSPLWKIGVFCVCRLFVTPVVWLWTRIWLGLRVRNRRAIRSLRGEGCFLYMNHTQDICDAYIPTAACFPKRACIVTGPEAVSIPGIRVLVAMLGAIPLPSDVAAARNYYARLGEEMQKGAAVTIFPEAHIWPYCNFVRDFPDTSFSYPVKLGAPVIAGVLVYRERRFLRRHHPHATLYLSDPIRPDPDLSLRQARRKLRGEAYRFMQETAQREGSCAYIEYRKRTEREEGSAPAAQSE